jgi:hypothetical protein
MSITTLTKFTVPSADAGTAAQGMLMPKLKYRFRVTLDKFGIRSLSTELTKQVVSVTRPNLTFENIQLDVYNSKVHLAGRHSWADVSLVIRDESTGGVSKVIGEQIQKQLDFFEQASAATGANYKFTTRIEMLDGGNGLYSPTTLETWELYGCYIAGADYGNMAYGENTAAEITLTLKYENALQLAGAGGSAAASGVGSTSDQVRVAGKAGSSASA